MLVSANTTVTEELEDCLSLLSRSSLCPVALPSLGSQSAIAWFCHMKKDGATFLLSYRTSLCKGLGALPLLVWNGVAGWKIRSALKLTEITESWENQKKLPFFPLIFSKNGEGISGKFYSTHSPVFGPVLRNSRLFLEFFWSVLIGGSWLKASTMSCPGYRRL